MLGLLLFLVDAAIFLITYIKARQGMKIRRKLSNAGMPGRGAEDEKIKQAQIKMFKVFSGMFIGFILAFATAGAAIIFFALNDGSSYTEKLIPQVSLMLFGVSSVFNPILMMYFNAKFRPLGLIREMVCLLCRKKMKPGE